MLDTDLREDLKDTAAFDDPEDSEDPEDTGDLEHPVDDTDTERADAADDSNTDAPARATLRWPPRLSRLTMAVLAVLVVALAAVSGYLGWQDKNSRDIRAAAAAAQQAATSYAVTLTSVDSDDLDANFQAVLDGATGEFRDIYAASSAKLRTLLVEHRAAGHGVVIDSAVKSAGRDEVVVLLFVDQTISNTEVPDPRVDRSRMVMTMQRTDAGWKASKVVLP